jgi:hypothetical protein
MSEPEEINILNKSIYSNRHKDCMHVNLDGYLEPISPRKSSRSKSASKRRHMLDFDRYAGTRTEQSYTYRTSRSRTKSLRKSRSQSARKFRKSVAPIKNTAKRRRKNRKTKKSKKLTLLE